MVRLEDTVGKSLSAIKGGAYARCFGDLELSRLLSRVQSLIIKNGYELEKLITDLVSDLLIDDLDEFLSKQIMKQGVRIVEKKIIKKSDIIEGHSIEPDFIIFERVKSTQNCYIVELKDGHEFDTKSSAKEHANLNTFLSKNAMAFQYFQSYCKICGFNASSKEDIKAGFKNKIALSQALTGEDLCKLLNLDYGQIVQTRANDRIKNFERFLDDLMDISAVKEGIRQRLGLG